MTEYKQEDYIENTQRTPDGRGPYVNVFCHDAKVRLRQLKFGQDSSDEIHEGDAHQYVMKRLRNESIASPVCYALPHKEATVNIAQYTGNTNGIPDGVAVILSEKLYEMKGEFKLSKEEIYAVAANELNQYTEGAIRQKIYPEGKDAGEQKFLTKAGAVVGGAVGALLAAATIPKVSIPAAYLSDKLTAIKSLDEKLDKHEITREAYDQSVSDWKKAHPEPRRSFLRNAARIIAGAGAVGTLSRYAGAEIDEMLTEGKETRNEHYKEQFEKIKSEYHLDVNQEDLKAAQYKMDRWNARFVGKGTEIGV